MNASAHPRTAANARVGGLVTFGALAFFYLGTLALNVTSLRGLLLLAMLEPVFAWSFVARTIGAAWSLLIVGLGAGRYRLVAPAAWFFVVAVAAVLIADAVNNNAGYPIWIITGAAIAIHIMGALHAQRLAHMSH